MPDTESTNEPTNTTARKRIVKKSTPRKHTHANMDDATQPTLEPLDSPPQAPAQPRPAFTIVGEENPASKPPPAESFVFDPSKIVAQLTPQPAATITPTPPPARVYIQESGEIGLPMPPPAITTTASPDTRSDTPGTPTQQPYPNDNAKPDRRFSPAQTTNPQHNPQNQNSHNPNNHNPHNQHNHKPRHPHPNNPNNKKNHHPQKNQPGGHPQKKDKRHPHPNNIPHGKHWPGIVANESVDETALALGNSYDYEGLNAPGALDPLIAQASQPGEPFQLDEIYAKPVTELVAHGKSIGCKWHKIPPRRHLVGDLLAAAAAQQRPIHIHGTLELLEDGNGLLVYLHDNYRVRELSTYVPKTLIKQHGLQRGHDIHGLAHPPPSGETTPILVRVDKVMDTDPATAATWTPFTELTPYYPTQRILLENDTTPSGDNLSMRCIDLLCPIGLGQRGLIVAPPRTGKTVLLQGIANAIGKNAPQAHLIILLVDERPEEVTDFRRQVSHAEIVSSTFDENAESHVHAAEIVIERARRLVESGRHVVILLDSITRLARAYNTLMPSTGKILSGGVESNALSKPKRFFGSARNIEGGGSLTILGTALVETGSKMDEVIFEEFKGTGNMELDLDRDLSNKRIYPAINFERSGTRKEELLYHPDEMQKVYSLRRAMKGIPSVEAMEQLIQRIKKTKTNVEFLLTLAR